MTSSSFIDFRSVCVAYGKKRTVFDFTLSIPRGATFGLMGLNGAGKTTLIKALLGLRDMESGDIVIDGSPRSQGHVRQRIAYLPERFDPPSFLKGGEFVKFSMDLYKKPFDQAAMEALAVRLKLDPAVLNNRMTTYSKGMRQKVGLMATILTGCDFLVLDEPMSGLDPRARAAVKDVLKEIRGEGRTVFFSSHILSDMDELCDMVSVLDRGHITFTGTPAELKSRAGTDNIERAFLSQIDSHQPTADAA